MYFNRLAVMFVIFAFCSCSEQKPQALQKKTYTKEQLVYMFKNGNLPVARHTKTKKLVMHYEQCLGKIKQITEVVTTDYPIRIDKDQNNHHKATVWCNDGMIIFTCNKSNTDTYLEFYVYI